MIWGLEIPTLIALIGAFTAVGALVWNVVWSHKRTHLEMMQQIAQRRIDQIEKFRSNLAQYLALSGVQQKYFREGAKFDETRATKTLEIYHEILLSLPVDKPHFNAFRETLYASLKRQNGDDPSDASAALNDLEFTGLSLIAVEEKLARNEFSGKELK